MKHLLASLATFTTLCLVVSSSSAQTEAQFKNARLVMVEKEIVAAGIKNPRVLESMRSTPRHEFVSANLRKYAYYDMALPIGSGQTISPPFVVSFMTEALDPRPSDKILEIGTGSGYQAAVLSPLAKEVYSIEIVGSLGRKAARTLKRLNYDNVHTKVGDGFEGWPEHAPFDKIIVTCSPEKVPVPLAEQLREGGTMVIPVGERYRQNLYLLTKKNGKLVTKALRATLFVPMTGTAEEKREQQPDPGNPEINNGSFETLVGEPAIPSGWHYQRQLNLVVDPKESREGKHYITFKNEEPGRGCRALQGFAVDGRKVKALAVAFWIKADNVRFGQDRTQLPSFRITFYDERRATVDSTRFGPWIGSFDWQRETTQIPVPLKAREAIIHIGLFGAVGELSFDDLQMKALK